MRETKTLKDFMSNGDPRFIHNGMLLDIDSYDSFVECIHYAFDKIIVRNLESSKNLIIEDEDQISDRIVEMLYALNYTASRESSNNGNVDVTVALNEYVWLAEAKIYNSNPYLMDGFRQLTTRYASSSSKDYNKGGFLIYNFRAKTKQLLDTYRTESKLIFESEYTAFSQHDSASRLLWFYTKHEEQSAGLEYTVKHIPFSFFFEPKDKSGRKSNANRKKRNKKKLQNLAAKKDG